LSPEEEVDNEENEDEGDWEDETEEDEDSDLINDGPIEDDPFYTQYLHDRQLMDIGRIVRYELVRNYGEPGDSDEDSEEEPERVPVNTRVVPESEEEVIPPPPPVVVAAAPHNEQVVATDPTKLSPVDFEGLPRYRLAFLCVRHFEWTGIRNIAVASTISNEALMRALCQIPRGRAVADCSICSYPLWDSLETKCCSQSLCIHCVNRCAECPYCRAAEY
jgi:hypothetical protein